MIDWQQIDTVLLDMDSALAHERAIGCTAAAAEGAHDRMEGQPIAFYEAVRRGYLELAELEKARFFVADATGSIEAVADVVWSAMMERFDGIFG